MFFRHVSVEWDPPRTLASANHLGPLGHHGTSWAILGLLWAILGPSWAILGLLWASIGTFWASIGTFGSENPLFGSENRKIDPGYGTHMTIGGVMVRIVWHSLLPWGYPLAWPPCHPLMLLPLLADALPGRCSPGYIVEMSQCTHAKCPFWPLEPPWDPRAGTTNSMTGTTISHAEKACFDGDPVFAKKAVFAVKVHGREGHYGIRYRSNGEVKQALMAKLFN